MALEDSALPAIAGTTAFVTVTAPEIILSL